MTERKELRKRLNCKSFDWYVKNIYPDLFVPGEALASGEVSQNRILSLGMLGNFTWIFRPFRISSN